jgi:hypothetical protein
MAGYSEALEKELARVKYPGLGKNEIHKDLEPAAKAYVEGKFAEAYKLAEAVSDNTEDEKAEADADYIMERIDDRMSALSVRAETAEIMKDYTLAMKCWEELATYKGLEDAAEAPERLKKLQGDKTVEKEITARHELFRLMLALDVTYIKDVDPADGTAVTAFRKKCLEAYQKFAKENEGTAAAETANDLIEVFKTLLPPEEEKK